VILLEKLQNLTDAERIVFEYIKDQARQFGTIITKSTRDMADEISDLYAEKISALKRRKVVNGAEEHDHSISTATISRALKKLREEGIVSVRASSQKDKPNEIIYLGMPNAEEQVEDIINMAKHLSLSLSRFEAILAKKDKQIREAQSQKRMLMLEIDQLRDQIAELEKINQQLRQNDPFNGGKLLSVTDLGDGTTAYIVQR